MSVSLYSRIPLKHDVHFIWLYCMTFRQCVNWTWLLLCCDVLYYGSTFTTFYSEHIYVFVWFDRREKTCLLLIFHFIVDFVSVVCVQTYWQTIGRMDGRTDECEYVVYLRFIGHLDVSPFFVYGVFVHFSLYVFVYLISILFFPFPLSKFIHFL